MSSEGFKETEIGLIPKSWELLSIDDIKSKKRSSIAMGPFGSNITKDNFIEYGVPVIRGVNLSKYKFKEDGFVYLSEDKANELKSSNAFPKDIILTHRGTLGQVGIIPIYSKYPRYVVSQSQMKLSCNEKVVNPFYVFYYLNSKLGQDLLLMNTSQTGVPAIARPTTSLKQIKIPIPSIQEQNEIVKHLQQLDDKIQLNYQINQTLENIGQELFRHWFVYFEFPDENGQPYKSSNGNMVESEIGLIPLGWDVKNLNDICNIIMGQSPKSKFYNEDGVGLPFHQGVTNFGIRFPNDKIFCTKENKIAKSGDILFSVRAPVGRINIAKSKMVIGRGLSAVRHKNNLQSFVLYQLKNIFTKEDSIGSGTVFNAITRKDLDNLDILVPNQDLDKQFNDFIKPMEKQIEKLELENNYLIKIRDLILPKLISGKIRVKDVEEV
ncbi:restriction endonuclease subunit S [Methanobacterium sp. SMA-27]|uniref:restriction endonuclease subunit S n=1 Tax=Methanobacterium sp. SMA-27 TaxID=1495336 RepID=UPI00064FB80C|nr:restriction endonuclease subunit S [Methanobacterium sp. SMA-27]